jgi:hypothetical protein
LHSDEECLDIYTDGSRTSTKGTLEQEFVSNCLASIGYLNYATDCDGELEAMNIVLTQLYSRIESFKNTVIFADSTAAIVNTKALYTLARGLQKFLYLFKAFRKTSNFTTTAACG